MTTVSTDLADILTAHTDTTTAAPCWIWTGYVHADGFGVLRHRHGSWVAHRVAYELHTGLHPGRRLVIAQACGERLCVNPEHLVARRRPRPRTRPNRNNTSGVLGVSKAGDGWRGARTFDGVVVFTPVYPTVAEAAEELARRAARRAA
jgi:hypothetical protein